MSVRRKMGLQIAAMIAALIAVSAAALWGLNGLHTDYGLAMSGYEQLRRTYEIGTRLATAQALLQRGAADRDLALAAVSQASNECDLLRSGMGSPAWAASDLVADPRLLAQLQQSLDSASAQLSSHPQNISPDDLNAADNGAVGQAIAQVSTLSGEIRRVIEAHQQSGDARRHTTITVLAIFCATVLAGGIILGIMQYRGVVRPLRRLGDAVRRIAAGHLDLRIPESGPEEFALLARDFNRMAAELEGFYHQLEAKVSQKGKELILSERLASVGYLAAGVAHEINNPLGIIAGYAEYMLGELRKADNGSANAELLQSLKIICDEAFRCKEITGKLLSLARGGEDSRQNVCLADVAEQVVSIVGGLRDYRNRKLTLVTARDENGVEIDRESLTINAVEAQMKQMLLNLTLNALEATKPDDGQVRISLSRKNDQVELMVSDNGRGMSNGTLERVFEPFFTDKRGSRQPGTGLGLSITHQIVESHGGTIVAQSDGLDCGSRFIVRLPALAPAEVPS